MSEELPEGWEFSPIGAVVSVNYGKALRGEDRKPGPFVVFGSGGAVGEHDSPLTTGETIVIGRKGSFERSDA